WLCIHTIHLLEVVVVAPSATWQTLRQQKGQANTKKASSQKH
ncbi:unnamed protein product, partial [Brassica oleracea var. botrytis]